MMTPSNKWYAIAARAMCTARPDLWKSALEAEDALQRWVAEVVLNDADSCGSGGFEVHRTQENDRIAWRFVRLIADNDVYGIDDHEVFDWTSFVTR